MELEKCSAAKRGELLAAFSFLRNKQEISQILSCLDDKARIAGNKLYARLGNLDPERANKLAEKILRQARVIKFKHEDTLREKLKRIIKIPG